MKNLFNENAVFIQNARWADEVPYAGSYDGKMEILNYFENLFSAIDIINFKYQFSVIDRENVHTHFNLKAKVISIGNIFDLEFVDLWQIDDNFKIIYCRRVYDTFTYTQAFDSEGSSLNIDLKSNPEFHLVKEVDFDSLSIAQNMYNDFLAGNLAAFLSVSAHDIDWTFKGPQEYIPFAGQYYSHEGVIDFMNRLGSTAVPLKYDMSFISEKNKVEILIDEQWLITSTGKIHDIYTFHSLTYNNDGLLINFVSTNDSYDTVWAYSN